MHVLLIDDERPFLSLVKQLLRERHHEVRAVEDASEALGAVAREHFDAIVCDLNMPGMSGADFVRKLSPDDAEHVILMTGGAASRADEEFLRTRPTLYKPFSAVDLIDAIEAMGSSGTGRMPRVHR